MKPQEQRQTQSTSTKKTTKTAVANRVAPPARSRRGKPSARVIAERYHALALAAGHITWTTDSAGGIIDATDWYTYTGQTPEAAAGAGWLAPVHPDDRAMVQREWQQAIAARCPYELEYRIRRADGVYRTFLVRGVPIFAPDGTLREWTGFCADITTRRSAEDERDQARAEAAARAGELEVIFEAIADGIIVVDQFGAIVHANRAYCSLLALESAVGFTARHALLCFRDKQGRQLSPARLPLSRILRGEVVLGADAVDLAVSRLDGHDVILNVSGAPLTAADGSILGGVIVLRDVTQRRHLEEQSRATLTALLKMAEALVSDDTPFAQSGFHSLHDKAAQRLVELTRSVFGCQSVGVATITPDMHAFAPAAIIAATPTEEHFWWRTMQRAHFDTHFTVKQQAHLLAGDSIRYMLHKHVGAQGSEMCEVLLAPIHQDERLVGLLGLEHAHSEQMFSEHELALIKAITRLAAITIERKRLVHEREEAVARELASQEAQQRMDEFLSVISHELRAPLTLIKGNVQLAERRLQHVDVAEMEAPDIAERVQSACNLLRRADRQIGLENRLVSDLLDAARMHAEHLDLLTHSCDLVALAGEIVEEVRQIYPARLIRFAAPSSAIVAADAERIGQVVMNYLTNALKYSPVSEPIDVVIERSDGAVRVSVRDRGMGLPAVEHERVWERFHRAPDSPQSGLGLGLYICRTIIMHHHGEVGLVSTPGQGATFWFTLPLAVPAADG